MSTGDGLDEYHIALSVAIIAQAAADHVTALECLYALHTPPEERGKLIKGRLEKLIKRHPYDEDIVEQICRREVARTADFFYGDQYKLYTRVDPEPILRECDRKASAWIESGRRGTAHRIVAERSGTNTPK